MTFAEELKELRHQWLELTQEQAAARIPKLSLRTYQGWEAGRVTPPDWAQVLVISALAGIKLEDVNPVRLALAAGPKAVKKRRPIADVLPLKRPKPKPKK